MLASNHWALIATRRWENAERETVRQRAQWVRVCIADAAGDHSITSHHHDSPTTTPTPTAEKTTAAKKPHTIFLPKTGLLRKRGLRGLQHVVLGGRVGEEREQPGPPPFRLGTLRYLVAVGARRPVLRCSPFRTAHGH